MRFSHYDNYINKIGDVIDFPVYIRDSKARRAPRGGGSDFVFTTRSPASKRASTYFYKILKPPYSMYSEELPFYKVLHAGRRIVASFAEPFACEDSYMSWYAGSTLIFWRWSPEFQKPALLGWPPRKKTTLGCRYETSS